MQPFIISLEIFPYVRESCEKQRLLNVESSNISAKLSRLIKITKILSEKSNKNSTRFAKKDVVYSQVERFQCLLQ